MRIFTINQTNTKKLEDMYINCRNKFSLDFINLVEQLLKSNDFSSVDVAGMKRIVINGPKGFWFEVSKETLIILYDEFKTIPFINIRSDLLFLEKSCQIK